MKRLYLLIGPLLFLAAELLLPNGSADPATRAAIVQNHSSAWELGHQLIAIACVFLIVWLGEVYTSIRKGNELIAYGGLLLSTLALVADYAVGILQMLTLDLVRTQSADQVQAMLTLVGQSSNLLTFAFLPTLAFFLGFGLLAIGSYRSTRQILPAVVLGLAGLLLAVAGLLQLKVVFVAGAIALLVFAVLFVRAKK